MVLGLDCSFRDAAAVIWPDEVKAAKWLAGIIWALGHGSFGPGEASKLLGLHLGLMHTPLESLVELCCRRSASKGMPLPADTSSRVNCERRCGGGGVVCCPRGLALSGLCGRSRDDIWSSFVTRRDRPRGSPVCCSAITELGYRLTCAMLARWCLRLIAKEAMRKL